MARIVVCISGASGVVLAHHTIEALLSLGHDVDCIISRDAPYTMLQELDASIATPAKFISSFSKSVRLHASSDFGSELASGSAHFDACVIVPCSMATLAAVATGLSDTLIRRVADVALKERRRLVIVPREAPFNEIHLENMRRLTSMGAILYPPVPAWYLHPATIRDMELAIVSRILDQLGIKNSIAPRWQGCS